MEMEAEERVLCPEQRESMLRLRESIAMLQKHAGQAAGKDDVPGDAQSEADLFDSALLADCNEKLWDAICKFQGFSFYTSKGLCYTYTVKGNEIFVDRKEKSKSIIRSSVEIAFLKAQHLSLAGVTQYGPKKLKVFGASYIWGIFRFFEKEKETL